MMERRRPISLLYRYLLRPLLFSLDPETAHELASTLLRKIGRFPVCSSFLHRWCTCRDPRLESTIFGLRFPNPVGLAAGFDKNASMLESLPLLGFGFIEVGTVTGRGQVGNPRPRLFRLPADQALINRMGFNNEGADAVQQRLQQTRKPAIPVGINLGKSRDVPLQEAVQDYLYSFERLYPYGDYFVINVSSPNTPHLRQLQDKWLLTELLQALQERNIQLATTMPCPPKPLLIKIAPDLSWSQLDDLLTVVAEQRLAGVIATNTTITREGLRTSMEEAGGLSGLPLRERSTTLIRYIFQTTSGILPIIGVGGIFSAQDAWEKIAAGASLIQVYTGLIYQGPLLIRSINQGLLRQMTQSGVQTISGAVGLQKKRKNT